MPSFSFFANHPPTEPVGFGGMYRADEVQTPQLLGADLLPESHDFFGDPALVSFKDHSRDEHYEHFHAWVHRAWSQ